MTIIQGNMVSQGHLCLHCFNVISLNEIITSSLNQEPAALRQPGEITGRTVLNVFGPMGHGGRWILDSLKVGCLHVVVLVECCQ